jgi:hypothetical protein
MFDRLAVVDSCLYVHQGNISLKTTKAFTHGSVVFDTNTGFVTFGKLPPVQLPPELVLEEGSTLDLKLVAPDGTLISGALGYNIGPQSVGKYIEQM